jgi:DNA-binding transcriptional ArsR family regulator
VWLIPDDHTRNLTSRILKGVDGMANRDDEFSRKLFGSEHRLRLLATIARAQPGDIFPQRVAELGGVAQSTTSTEMKKYVELGLLEVVRDNERRQKVHLRLDSPVWDFAHQVLASLERTEPSKGGRARRRTDGS